MQFTDRYILNLKPNGKKYFKREGRGFAVRVMPSGAKHFFYIYTFGGKRKHLNLGEYPAVKLSDARKKYMDAFISVGRGEDPDKEEISLIIEEEFGEGELPSEPTVAQMAAHYLNKYSKLHHSPEWHATIKLGIKNDILPEYGAKKIASIRRRDAIALVEKVAARAPGMARNVLKAAQGIWEYALQREYVDSSPFIKVTKALPSVRITSKERVLSDAEIKHVWDAISTGPGTLEVKRALKLVLVTAQRPGEVAAMRFDEIDEDWWVIPKEKTKSRRAHSVYLTPLAKELIGPGVGYVFPSRSGTSSISRMSLSQMVSRGEVTEEVLKIRAGNRKQKKRDNAYFGLAPWTPHDLRRTARTKMAELGVPGEYAEAVLNHAKEGISKVYNLHQYDKEKKEALLKWEEELRRIVG